VRFVDGEVSDILSLLAHAGADPRKASSAARAYQQNRFSERLGAVREWCRAVLVVPIQASTKQVAVTPVLA
jgi:hypothetical protein